MFAIIAAILFVSAAALALGTMTYMFRAYREKMIAALLYQPYEPTPAPQAQARHRSRPARDSGPTRGGIAIA